MTLEDLRAAYPGAADVCQRMEFRNRTLTRAAMLSAITNGWSPRRVVEELRRRADVAIAARQAPWLKLARHQLEHPDFVRYIAAKMGAL